MESICVAFRLDFESWFLRSSLGFKVSETYVIEEDNSVLFLWGTSSPKYRMLAIRALRYKEGSQKGRVIMLQGELICSRGYFYEYRFL